MTFVLVHGGWHGGWCWQRVAPLLREQGHRVTTPTLTGLGERVHLLTKSVDTSVFIEDIVNHILFEDLTDVVLVGHSASGQVTTGVADRVGERLAALIYLDALNPDDGEAWASEMPDGVVEARIKEAEAFSGGLSMPIPTLPNFGVERPEDLEWLKARLTPQPLASLTDILHLKHPIGNGRPCAYIACTAPAYPPAVKAHARAKARGWPILEIAAGHDAMIINPPDTAARLVEAAKMLRG
jgi:pimeloyl-ACP methyl ester carboxylesterase